jgi:signal transduction histidine kinase
MKIRTRLTFWYAGVLLLSALLIAVFSFDELRERHRRPGYHEHTWEEIVDYVLWIGTPAVVLSIGGGWWLMRKALTPIATLTDAAQRVNERNLAEQLPRTNNGDEFDRLTEVFNEMTARLNTSFNRVREFTLHASHELKTPLTVLCAETETALQDESLTPAQRERAVSQLEELRRLAAIVDSLTLLAKADAGLIKLALVPVRLDELMRDCFDDTQILAHTSGIRVELTNCEEATVGGDAHRLRQLLLNLADNAVKYNQPNGSISMSLRRAGELAELDICNTGPGVPPEKLPCVFDRFFRGDPAHNNTVEGCGLGLSIAQWIVSAHNGTIQMVSEPSKLTTVIVRLPLMREGKTA